MEALIEMDIVIAKSLEEINQAALKELIERGMGRRLVDGYFQKKEFVEFYLAMPDAGMLGKRLYAGAIVAANPSDSYPMKIVYLDKVVVAEEFRGNGVFSELWEKMRENRQKIFLRAKKTNPANELYKQRAGLYGGDKTWNIYHMGLSNDELKWAVAYALNIPESLLPQKTMAKKSEESRPAIIEPDRIIYPARPQVPLERASITLF